MPVVFNVVPFRLCAVLVCVAAALPALAQVPEPQTFRLNPVADTSLYSDGSGPGSSWDAVSDGAGESLWVANTAGGLVRRALLRFDLSAIPSTHQVLSASLTLYESRARDSHDVALHRVAASWGEGASNGGSAGTGAPAQAGDATWRWRDFGVSQWQARGGDFAAQASASLQVGFANSFYTWQSAAMAADVQAWVADPAGSFGWILIGNESGNQNAKRFDSQQSGVLSQRPLLVVQAAPIPEPASLWLLCAGVLGLLGWQRRVR